MKTSRTRQAVTGLAIAMGIVVTLLCGLVLALTEGQSLASSRPTPTVFHIPTLMPSERTALDISATPAMMVVVIPTSIPTKSAETATSTIPPASLAPSPAAARIGCSVPLGWVSYQIQPGDTLSGLAYRYRVRMTALLDANCGLKSDLLSGSFMVVPPVIPRPLPTTVNGQANLPTEPPPIGTQTATDGACTDPDSVISLPRVGAVLTGHVKISGTAQIPNFAFYRVEIRQEGTDQPYANLVLSHDPVRNGVLAKLDTSSFPNGEYWLQLVVVDDTSNYPERCAILVTLLH